MPCGMNSSDRQEIGQVPQHIMPPVAPILNASYRSQDQARPLTGCRKPPCGWTNRSMLLAAIRPSL